MAELCGGLTTSSNDSSSDSSSPPPRDRRAPTSTRKLKGAHRHKVKKGSKKSKGERNSRSSSSVSSSHDSDSTSEHVTSKGSKKHARQKKSPRKRKFSNHSDKIGGQKICGLFDIFQRHYSNLVKVIQTCPEPIANELFARKMMPAHVLSQVITGQDSQGKKASILLVNVSSVLEVYPEKLLDFINILKTEPSFAGITQRMLGKLITCIIRLHVHYSL